MSLFDSLFKSDKSGKAASLFAEDSSFAVRKQAEASESADPLAADHEQPLERKLAKRKRGQADAPTEPLSRQQAPAGQPAGTEASPETPVKLRKGKRGASAAEAAAAVPVPAPVAASDAEPPPGKEQKRNKAAAESAAGQPAQPATEGPAERSAKRRAKGAAEPAASQQVQAPAPGSDAGRPAKGQVKGAVEQAAPQAPAGEAITGADADAQRPAKRRAKDAVEPAAGQQPQAAAELPAAQGRIKRLKAAAQAARAAADGDEEAGADHLASADGAEQEHRHAGEAALAAADDAADNQPSATGGSGEQRLKLTPEEEAERLQRTAFVGNLPIAIKKRTLLKHFGRYGQIESLRLRSVPVKLDGKKMPRRAAVLTGNVSTERGTANAYIVFVEAESVDKALASNMQQLEGLHMRVDRAAPRCQEGSAGSGVHYERGRSVFVGNLPFDVEDEEVIALFSSAAAKLGMEHGIEAVRIVRDPTSNLGKGFGFVLFSSQPAARAALSLNDAKLRNRPIRVTKVVKIPDHLKGGLNKAGRKPNKGAVRRMSSGYGKGETTRAGRAAPKLQSGAGGASSWQGFKTKGAKKTSAPLNIKSKPRTSAKPGPSKAGKGFKSQRKQS